MAENVRTAVKATIRRGEAAARRRVRSTTTEKLGELKRVYRRAAEEIRREISEAAGPDANIRLDSLETLKNKIEARLQGLGRQRDELLQAGMREASRIGVSPFQEVPELKTDLVNVADDALRAVEGLVGEDGLQLSDRLWRLNRGAREAVTERLEQAVIRGHGASRAAQDFLERGESVPADVRDKMNAANADRVARQSSRALLRTDDERSALANALRVFRTEINRAHGQAFQAAAFEHPDVIGTRFLLSPAHPEPDICDMHARVNLYGLGPGVYPKGKSPWPAHPNTLSFEQVVFRDEPTQADADGREDRISWIKKQEPNIQEAVLGGRKKRAALQKGILKQNEITTPWKVLKKRYEKRGIDTDTLRVTPEAPRSRPPIPERTETLNGEPIEANMNDFVRRWQKEGAFASGRMQRVRQKFIAPEEIPQERGDAYHLNGRIHMGGREPTRRIDRAVFRHEYGHHIDQQLAIWVRGQGRGDRAGTNYSNGPAGNRALKADADRLERLDREYFERVKGRRSDTADKEYNEFVATLARDESAFDFIDRNKGRVEEAAAAEMEGATGVYQAMWRFVRDKGDNPAMARTAMAYRDNDPVGLIEMNYKLRHPSGPNMYDLIGAITRNRYGGGHDMDYYAAREGWGQQAEAFANAFDLLDYARKELPREFLSELAPNWEEFVNSILEEVDGA